MTRTYPRISIGPLDARASIDGDQLCPIKNISLGGVFVRTTKRYPVGGSVWLAIDFDGKKLETEARPTHLQLGGVGLSYVTPTKDFLYAVENLIDKLLSAGIDFDERRRVGRVTASAALVWNGDGSFHHGQIKNVSVSGAFIVSTPQPSVEARISVYLPAFTYAQGSRHPSELRGCLARVVRNNPEGFSIQFVKPSAEFSMALEQIIAAAQLDPAPTTGAEGQPLATPGAGR